MRFDLGMPLELLPARHCRRLAARAAASIYGACRFSRSPPAEAASSQTRAALTPCRLTSGRSTARPQPAETVSYNPADFKDLPKGAFPFRNTVRSPVRGGWSFLAAGSGGWSTLLTLGGPSPPSPTLFTLSGPSPPSPPS